MSFLLAVVRDGTPPKAIKLQKLLQYFALITCIQLNIFTLQLLGILLKTIFRFMIIKVPRQLLKSIKLVLKLSEFQFFVICRWAEPSMVFSISELILLPYIAWTFVDETVLTTGWSVMRLLCLWVEQLVVIIVFVLGFNTICIGFREHTDLYTRERERKVNGRKK